VAVDLKKVMQRQAEDVQLQPSDILYVPDSAARKALLRTAELGIALGPALLSTASHTAKMADDNKLVPRENGSNGAAELISLPAACLALTFPLESPTSTTTCSFYGSTSG